MAWFGYEVEHYAMTSAIGEILENQFTDSPRDVVVAPGASCRTQPGDMDANTQPLDRVPDDEQWPLMPIQELPATLKD